MAEQLSDQRLAEAIEWLRGVNATAEERGHPMEFWTRHMQFQAWLEELAGRRAQEREGW